MPIDITVEFPGICRVGEGPFWDPESGSLSWVDILDGTLHRARPGSAERWSLQLATLVGAAVPKASGGYVAATSEGFTDISPDGAWTVRRDFLPDGIRMNDAKCDPHGRLWAGSCGQDFAAGRGGMHVLLPDWTVREVFSGLTQPNGLGWSPDGRRFYLVETQARDVSVFDVVSDRLEPENRRTLASFSESCGYPDGLTVDADGCLWIAFWGGGRVLQVAPHDGRVLRTVEVPVPQPSSCAFGGPELDVLYVTTAREGLDPDLERPSGSVLAIRGLGVRGLPAVKFGG